METRTISSPPSTPRGRMVVAEDDDEVRAILVQIFERDGFVVSSARNGEELVRLLERSRDEDELPDILITDHRMPGFTGLDVVEALRQNSWPVPVIVITAYAVDLDETGLEGVDLVFHKPFDADDLRTAVFYCLGSR